MDDLLGPPVESKILPRYVQSIFFRLRKSRLILNIRYDDDIVAVEFTSCVEQGQLPENLAPIEDPGEGVCSAWPTSFLGLESWWSVRTDHSLLDVSDQ